MAEYIEREKAIDALNKALFVYEDEAEETFKTDPELDISDWFFHRIFVQSMNGIDRQTILDLPAENVRHVVFCKDCRHRDPEDHKCDCGETERQGCPFKVADDYFCAYGEGYDG